MKILELNIWKDFNKKYLNFSAKYTLNIHKLDFGIIWVKMWIKFSNMKSLGLLLFWFKTGKKNLNQGFKEVQVKPQEC